MRSDDFWTVDRLLPPIPKEDKFNKAVPMRAPEDTEFEEEFQHFLSPIRPEKSRTIKEYRLTKIRIPQCRELLSDPQIAFETDFVPCSQFMPSFREIELKQKQYFYYFSAMVEKRKKVPVSFPYLHFYLCRVLRKIDKLHTIPEEILWLWKTYRAQFPLADKLFCDVIFDLSLILKIAPPWEKILPIVLEEDFRIKPLLINSLLFDYAFQNDRKLQGRECELPLKFLSRHSFRQSKAYRSNGIFATAVEDAVERSIAGGLFNRSELNSTLFQIPIPSEVRTIRRLFQGLNEKEAPQGSICLKYVPYLFDVNILDRCDDLVRYPEQKLRSIMKMKNSLSRIHISAQHREYLDSILSSYLNLAPQEKDDAHEKIVKASPPPREIHIDPVTANLIEEESWQLTKSLTEIYTVSGEEAIHLGSDEVFDQKYETDLNSFRAGEITKDTDLFWEFAAALSSDEEEIVRVALYHDTDKARESASVLGVFFDAIILSCNQKALSAIGDQIFDGAGNLYSDYHESLKAVIWQQKEKKS